MVLEDKKPKKPDPPRRLVTPVFVLITLSTFAYFVAVGVLTPSLPRFVKGVLGGNGDEVGYTIGAFSLAAILIRPVTGRWGDTRGRRSLILIGASVVCVSIAAYSLVSSLWPLIGLRLLTGVGEAGFYVGVASSINDIAPNERRGEALSFFSLALYAGLAVGPLIGERVLDAYGFTPVWLVAAGAAGIAVLLGIGVPDTRPEGTPDHSRLVHPAALMPGLALTASVWGLAGFSSFAALYADDLGMSGAAIVFATYSAIVLAFRLFGARIPDRFGPSRTARTSLVITAVGLGLIGIWATPAGLLVGTAIFAMGQATAFPALMTVAINGAPASQRSAVVGTFTAFFDLAFGLGAVSLGHIVRLFGYNASFLAAAVISSLGAILLRVQHGRSELFREEMRARRVQEGCEPY